jgi:hypothetical protein
MVPSTANLQVDLSIGQRKIFLTQETLDKLRENLWLRLLGKEMGEEALEGSSSNGNMGARQISLQLED